MIECPTCKISFSPRHRICPRCGAYEAKLEDRTEYLANAAEIALDRGTSRAEVESMLADEGLPALLAHEIVSAKSKKVSRAERSYGLVRLVGGLAIELVASIAAIFAVFGLPSPAAARLLALALIVAAAGAPPVYLGIYSVLSGREKRSRRPENFTDR